MGSTQEYQGPLGRAPSGDCCKNPRQTPAALRSNDEAGCGIPAVLTFNAGTLYRLYQLSCMCSPPTWDRGQVGGRQEGAYTQNRLPEPVYLIEKWIVPSLDSCSVRLATNVDFDHRFYVVAT